MVKRLLLLACFVAAPALGAPGYQLDRKRIALGETATLTLTARPGTLDKVDLTRLARSFEILNRNLGRDKATETLTLTLVPRSSGHLDLAIPGMAGRAPVLEVTDGSKDVPRVHFQVETQPAVFHARQPVRFTLEACEVNAGGGLAWTRPLLPTREGLLVRALGEEQQEATRDGQRCTAQRWHWAVTPTAAGTITLPLPMLDATQLGRRLRFPPPPVPLQAQPLPAWLPAAAAIGKPGAVAVPLPAAWPIERPLAWRFEVAGGYSADALKSLLSLQLAAHPQLNAYPPTVDAVAGESAVPRHAVTLYLLAHAHGEANLPELTLPWYDPATGRLEQLLLPGATLAIVDPLRQNMLLGLMVFGALAAATALAWLARRMLGWRWRRRAAIAGLAQVADIADLSRRLRGFSLRGGVSPAPTLGEWQKHMAGAARTDGLAQLVALLEQAHYGTTAPELAALKQQAGACLRTAAPI